MLLVPWVIPPAMSTLAWLWLFDPSYSAFNWVLAKFGIAPAHWLGEAGWARFSVILVNVWAGAPFFLIMYLAALKSVPDQLYEAAEIDGANWLQKLWYVTLPMMRNIILITVLFSLVVTFANFDIIRASYLQILTRIFIPVALPGIIAAMIFSFTVAWAQFLYPLAMTTSTDQLVLPVCIITSLIKGDVFNWGQIMTGALLGAAPPLIIHAFLMDYYIAGLTSGATKA